VVYLLQPGNPPSLTLGKSRPLKKGGHGKPASYRPQPYDLGATRSHRDFILDEDIAPLRLFLALQAGGGYYYNDAVDVTNETGALLLRLALRTGRLYLAGLVELPLTAGAPAAARPALVAQRGRPAATGDRPAAGTATDPDFAAVLPRHGGRQRRRTAQRTFRTAAEAVAAGAAAERSRGAAGAAEARTTGARAAAVAAAAGSIGRGTRGPARRTPGAHPGDASATWP
jgi:hypothetical protein